MDLVNKNILIVGLGISGASVARFAKGRGADVTVTDMAGRKDLGAFADTIEKQGISMELGRHRTETFERADLIVLSPGVPHTILPVQRAKEKGAIVLGEVELASRFITEPIVAVTGTNGKTTTTSLVGEMLKKSGVNVFVGGNIGNPLIEYVDKGDSTEVVVVEVSSFQLDTIDTFQPKVGVLLNITEDHLDRYSGFNSYVDSKARIFKNQNGSDTAVLNGADPLIRTISRSIKSRKLFFNARQDKENGAAISSKTISFETPNTPKREIPLNGLSLVGRHNFENIAAAGLATLSVGGSFEGIRDALANFKGLSHRLEFVDTIEGVYYYDDSKATNVDAVARALESFSTPVILIMGGRDKGGDYGVLKDLIRRQVKKLIVMGEAAGNIKKTLGRIVPTASVENMTEAVSLASNAADPGDTVLLSPACASFDMYKSYAERGASFCNAVARLKKRRGKKENEG